MKKQIYRLERCIDNAGARAEAEPFISSILPTLESGVIKALRPVEPPAAQDFQIIQHRHAVIEIESHDVVAVVLETVAFIAEPAARRHPPLTENRGKGVDGGGIIDFSDWAEELVAEIVVRDFHPDQALVFHWAGGPVTKNLMSQGPVGILAGAEIVVAGEHAGGVDVVDIIVNLMGRMSILK